MGPWYFPPQDASLFRETALLWMLALAIGYLIGSISPGYLVARWRAQELT